MTPRKGLLARGVCPVCGGEWAVVDTGVMRGHKGTKLSQIDPKTWYCLGSQKKPTEITREAS